MVDTFDITSPDDGGKPRTMSSLEIAELTGKRHDHVMRDIRVMLSKLCADEVSPDRGKPSDLGEYHRSERTQYKFLTPGTMDAFVGLMDGKKGEYPFQGSYVEQQNGQTYPCFYLPRRECLILVSGYSIKLRARIIDRWEELETRATVEHVDPVAMLNDPAAMRGILLGYTEKVIALESKIEADKPKTGFYDQYVNADGLYGLQNAARAINCHPNLFTRWLKQEFMFYQGNALVPRVRYLQMGLFEVKSEMVDEKARPRSWITAKGLEYFSSRAPANIRLKGAA